MVSYRICQRGLKKQLDELLIEEGYSNLLVSQREGRRHQSASVIQKHYKLLRRHRIEKKAVKTLWKWFQRKQEMFKKLIAKMGTGSNKIVFQKKDVHAVVSAVVEVQNAFRKEPLSYLDGMEKARENIETTNVLVVREFTHANIIGTDAEMDGIFR
jgi:hypothetical protein